MHIDVLTPQALRTVVRIPGSDDLLAALLTDKVLYSAFEYHAHYCMPTAVACLTVPPESGLHSMRNRMSPLEVAVTMREPSFVVPMVVVEFFVSINVLHGASALIPTLDHDITIELPT